MRRVVVTVVACALLLYAGARVFGWFVAGRQEPQRTVEQVGEVAVRVATLERTSHREVLTGYGRAQALRRSAVAAEVAGLVRWIAPELEAGAPVAAGAELVRIDDRDLVEAEAAAEARLGTNTAEARRLEVELETNRGKLAVARDELAAAERELERERQLQESRAGTQSDIDRQSMQVALRRTAVLEWEGRIASTRAQVERLAAERAELASVLRRARLERARAVVRAPYAGRIESRRVQPGERVAPGTVLFELVDLSRIEVPVALAASRFGEVQEGAEASLRLGETEVWKGPVARIAPVVKTGDRTFEVYLVVEGPADASAVPPGAFLAARVEGRRWDGVFVVPRTAVIGDRVFVAENGVARAREPSVRHELPHLLLCEGGLAEGEELILTNLDEVAEGTRVAPSPADGRKDS